MDKTADSSTPGGSPGFILENPPSMEAGPKNSGGDQPLFCGVGGRRGSMDAPALPAAATIIKSSTCGRGALASCINRQRACSISDFTLSNRSIASDVLSSSPNMSGEKTAAKQQQHRMRQSVSGWWSQIRKDCGIALKSRLESISNPS